MRRLVVSDYCQIRIDGSALVLHFPKGREVIAHEGDHEALRDLRDRDNNLEQASVSFPCG